MEKYIVVNESKYQEFKDSVNHFLKKGYRCQGGVSVGVTPSAKVIIQAMVLKPWYLRIFKNN